MPSEFTLIERYFRRESRSAFIGPGDDCAVISPSQGMALAYTKDMLVAGTHFLPETNARDLGWKTLAVNLSDLAAMGAQPRWALLALALPTADEVWISDFAEGFFACADQFGVELIGGDTTRGPCCLCVTAIGELPVGRGLRRSGMQVGDDLWLSGTPGLAALGLAHLQARSPQATETTSLNTAKGLLPPSLIAHCVRALQRPWPRVELGLALRDIATAAIDVSDGVLADLTHMLKASNLAAQLHSGQLPRLPAGINSVWARECQLTGGDDYELCFSASPVRRLEIAALAAQLNLPLWRIGCAIAPKPLGAGEIYWHDADGLLAPDVLNFARKGFDHFG